MAIDQVQNQESGGSARGKINDSIEEANKVTGKMDKIPTAQDGNAAVFLNGQLIDSGQQLGGGTGSNIPEWDNVTIFPLDFVVQFNSKLFASKIADNQGNTPPLEGENTFWRETSESASTTTPLWVAGIYNKERAEVYVLDVTIYKKYVLTVSEANLPFESVDFAAELIAGTWQLIGPGGGLDDIEDIFFEEVAPDDAKIVRGFTWKVTAKTDYGGVITLTTSADTAYNLNDPVTAGGYLKATSDTANARTILTIQAV